MVAPSGGNKDVLAPTLLSVHKKYISDKKQQVILFEFDEYIQLNNWEENFYFSPPLKTSQTKKIKGKSLVLKIDDSFLENTTYYVCLNSCIKDNNEGNILDTLSYIFSTGSKLDTINIIGNIKDAYSLNPLKNFWVMLYDESINDTLIFKETPSYISKTDENGLFVFPNLKTSNFKIAAISGSDFFYDTNEQIAFSDSIINFKKDSFISLFAFLPDEAKNIDLKNRSSNKIDSSNNISNIDTVTENAQIQTGVLEININNNIPCAFQLIQNEKIIKTISFINEPYVISDIFPGEYYLKYIVDSNQDGSWTSGNWKKRKQPEQVFNYPSKITIRSNWYLELDWSIVQ